MINKLIKKILLNLQHDNINIQLFIFATIFAKIIFFDFFF